MKLTPFVLQVLCSHVFNPSNRENMLVPLAGSGPLMNFKSLKCFKEFTEILLKHFWLPFPNIILPHMDDDSIGSLVLHLNAPKFLVHIRDCCLRKAAGSSSPGTDVSNNRVAHYQSPGLGWAECRCLLDLERLLVAMLAAGWFDPSFVIFWDSSSTFINASNLFSRCIGGCRIPVLTSLVIAVSGVEDATAAIRDTRDNLMSREPLGLAPCLCHLLVRRSIFGLFLYTWYKLLRFTRFTGFTGLTGCMLRGSVVTICCMFRLFWKSSK